jgi:hypothetical protein
VKFPGATHPGYKCNRLVAHKNVISQSLAEWCRRALGGKLPSGFAGPCDSSQRASSETPVVRVHPLLPRRSNSSGIGERYRIPGQLQNQLGPSRLSHSPDSAVCIIVTTWLPNIGRFSTVYSGEFREGFCSKNHPNTFYFLLPRARRRYLYSVIFKFSLCTSAMCSANGGFSILARHTGTNCQSAKKIAHGFHS